MVKSVKLNEDTQILLSKVKARLLLKKPKEKYTDDFTIHIALTKMLVRLEK